MFGFGWLALRQAQEALNTGRLEEARRLLSQPTVQSYRRHGELTRQLARLFAERGERHLRLEDPEAAWVDLRQAEALQTLERGVERLRLALTRLGLAQVRGLLQAGEPRRASTVIGQLREQSVRGPEIQLLEETTRDWLLAQDLAEQGEYTRALEIVDRIQRLLLGPSAPLEQFRQQLDEKQRRVGPLLGRLHEASQAGKWRELLEAAESLLNLAPQHAEGRKARARAWQAVEPVTVAFRPPAQQLSVRAVPSPTDALTPRFLLWVDGVGGYLVCLASTITLGQSSVEPGADIPLVADVSRLHATLTRDGEGGYLLEAARPVLLNGQQVQKSLLKTGDRITLGTSCQLQFHKPVPVSSSARLDLVSGHRSFPGVDAILLMADTLLLGPGPQAHIELADLRQPVVLFRNKDNLGVRHAGNLLVNGERVKERGMLGATATLSGDDFALALEPLPVHGEPRF